MHFHDDKKRLFFVRHGSYKSVHIKVTKKKTHAQAQYFFLSEFRGISVLMNILNPYTVLMTSGEKSAAMGRIYEHIYELSVNILQHPCHFFSNASDYSTSVLFNLEIIR